jgi:hypothetical protein
MQTASVHWTTYVQTFAVIASTIGTFVYVYFTYHIMKWAVGQAKANIELQKLSIESAGQSKAANDNDIANRLLGDAVLLLLGARFSAAGLDELREAEKFLTDMASNWRTLLRQSLPGEVRVRLQEAWDSVTVAVISTAQVRRTLDEASDQVQIAAALQALDISREQVAWQLVALVREAYGANAASSVLKAVRAIYPEVSENDKI